jgi:hypothetical protein
VVDFRESEYFSTSIVCMSDTAGKHFSSCSQLGNDAERFSEQTRHALNLF